jgi:hypothetical protein
MEYGVSQQWQTCLGATWATRLAPRLSVALLCPEARLTWPRVAASVLMACVDTIPQQDSGSIYGESLPHQLRANPDGLDVIGRLNKASSVADTDPRPPPSPGSDTSAAPSSVAERVLCGPAAS